MSETAKELVEAARAAAGQAYAPYSNFYVGAAIRTADGRVFTAANVENASYGLSLCAEANAVAAAAVAGSRVITEVAVVGYPANLPPDDTLAAPCGRCRQMIAEFAASGARIHLANRALTRVTTHTIEELLPLAFGRAALVGTPPADT
ncbi:cytidine deaminase [Acuticoccus sp. M5D2P5]|uniref:cytidine deaminase n=1 Tax=Acuticoccus kalidii TaxID=2910977 RepID=UPI001F219F4F|nr:cytidine deaminase [Acuticoccus kalidii]